MAKFLAILICLLSTCGVAVAQTATWNGRQYSQRVCSNPRCQMCASIQSQLQQQVTVRFPPVASPAVASQVSTVVFYTGSGCVHCERWKQLELPKLQRRGWRVETRQAEQGRAIPYFDVLLGSKTVRHEGYLDMPSLTSYMPAKPVLVPAPVPVVPPPTEPALDLLTVTELQPTPFPVVAAMLAAMDLGSDSKLFDLGCGDGRFLTTAAKYYGTSGYGVELNPKSVRLARRNAELDFVSPMVTIFEGDVRQFDIAEATHITLYLYPELMAEVLPKIKPGTVVASYLHPLEGMEAELHSLTIEGQTHQFYVGGKR